MSAAEFHRWIEYRNRYGPMNDERMVDRPAALLATIASKMSGGKAEMVDFMPFTQPVENVVRSPAELAAMFGGVKR